MEKLIIKGHPNYVPRAFAKSQNLDDWGIAKADVEHLLDFCPDDVFWGTWNEVIDKAQTVMDGVPYTLDHRNDGLYAISK